MNNSKFTYADVTLFGKIGNNIKINDSSGGYYAYSFNVKIDSLTSGSNSPSYFIVNVKDKILPSMEKLIKYNNYVFVKGFPKMNKYKDSKTGKDKYAFVILATSCIPVENSFSMPGTNNKAPSNINRPQSIGAFSSDEPTVSIDDDIKI